MDVISIYPLTTDMFFPVGIAQVKLRYLIYYGAVHPSGESALLF